MSKVYAFTVDILRESLMLLLSPLSFTSFSSQLKSLVLRLGPCYAQLERPVALLLIPDLLEQPQTKQRESQARRVRINRGDSLIAKY